MLCKTLSRAFFCFLFLFMATTQLITDPSAPDGYVYDKLTDDVKAAITRTHKLEAMLAQETIDNPSKKIENDPKISALRAARAALADVYTTPLEDSSGADDSDGAATASERKQIANSRLELAKQIPEVSETRDEYGFTRRTVPDFNPNALNQAVTAHKQTQSQLEKSRRQLATAFKSELTTLEKAAEDAEKEFRLTGDPEAFIDAQKKLQINLDAFGPLRRASAFASSADLVAAQREKNILKRAAKILEELKKTTDPTKKNSLEARATILSQELAKAEIAVKEATQAVANVKKRDEAARAEFEDQLRAQAGETRRQKSLAGEATDGAGFDASEAITTRQQALSDRVETLQWQKSQAESAKNQAELKRIRAGLEAAQAKLADDPSNKRNVEARDEFLKQLAKLPTAPSPKDLAQAQRDLEDFNAKVAAADAITTPEKRTAAQTELAREAKTQTDFEEQVANQEMEKIIRREENELRIKAAQQMFEDIDSVSDGSLTTRSTDSDGSDDFGDVSPPKTSSLADEFKKLPTKQQLELTRYLEYPEDDRTKSFLTYDSEHPFKKFITAMTSSSTDANDDGTFPVSRFKQMYDEAWGRRRAELWTNITTSPTTMARLYKENPSLFAAIREQVDAESARATELKTVRQQKEEAAFTDEQRRIKAKNDAELDERYRKFTDESGVTRIVRTPEQARQLRILYKAEAYYTAIEQTIKRLQIQLADEMASARNEEDKNAVKARATRLLDALSADIVPFLTERGTLDTALAAGQKPKNSEQLTIFREELAKQGIEFARDQDEAPEITNALNLLKKPSSADPQVLGAFNTRNPTPQPLALQLASNTKILKAQVELKKLYPEDDRYVSPTETKGSRIKSASELADQAAQITAARSKVTAMSGEVDDDGNSLTLAQAEARRRTAGTTAEDSDLRSLTPRARLFIVADSEGNVIDRNGTFLMSDDDATNFTSDEGYDIRELDLDLPGDMTPEKLRSALMRSLQKAGIDDDNLDALAESILPSDSPRALETEITSLQRIRRELLPLEQNRLEAERELGALQMDAEFRATEIPDDAERAGIEDDDDEDTRTRKIIKYTQEVMDYYRTTQKAADDDEADKIKRDTHAYLLSVINASEENASPRSRDKFDDDAEGEDEETLSPQNRKLLLALKEQALAELRQEAFADLNKEESFDPDEVQDEMRRNYQQRKLEDQQQELDDIEAEATNPLARAKRAELEDARKRYETELEHIRKGLVPDSDGGKVSDDQLTRAHKARRQAKATFDEETARLNDERIRYLDMSTDKLATEMQEKIEAAKNTRKAITDQSSDEAKTARAKEIELRQQLEQIRATKPEEMARRKSESRTKKAEMVSQRTAKLESDATSGKYGPVSHRGSSSVDSTTARSMVTAKKTVQGPAKRERKQSRTMMIRS